MNGTDRYGEASVSSLEPRDYPLFRAVFDNDAKEVKRLLQQGNIDLAKRNPAGDCALHLACMLGNREIIHLLIEAGAPVNLKNNNGWTPLAEAISFGSREIIIEVIRASRLQARATLSAKKPALLHMLHDLPDFYLEFKWTFQSWVPLLSKILPSDVCRIYKKGCALRMDSSLMDLNDKAPQRGNISFIFNPNFSADQQFIMLDNNAKTYQRMKNEPKTPELDEEIDVLMSSDIIDISMSTKPIIFTRTQVGWFFRQEKSEDICGFSANYYEVQNLNLITRKRREHLSSEDVKKNKGIMQKFVNGKTVNSDELGWSERRTSIAPPTRPPMTFEEYITALEPVSLGREPQIKVNTKSFTASVAMSEDFPLSVDTLVSILEVLSPAKHMRKLKEFCQSKLPPGFPVRMEIPIFPTISAKVTFQRYELCDDLNDRMFSIPRDYKQVVKLQEL